MFKLILSFIIMAISSSVYAKHLSVGYSNRAMRQFSAKDVTIATNIWLQQLVLNSHHTATFAFYSDKDLAKELDEGKIDYASAYGLAYIKYFDLLKLQAAFTGGSKNRTDENLVLILSRKMSKEKFIKLKKPSVSFLDGNELAQLYTRYIFLKSSNNTKITFLPKRTNYAALLDLFFGKVDAAVIVFKTFTYANELNPQISKVLYIAQKTNLCAGNFGFFSKRLEPSFQKEIKSLAMALNDTKRGKQILDMFRTNAVVEVKISDLQPIEKLYRDYQKLKDKFDKKRKNR